MLMCKIIGISSRLTKLPYEERDSLALDWHNFFRKVLPDYSWLIIPNDKKNVELLCNNISFSGFILSGGDDIGLYKERDKTETFLLDYAMNNSLPLVGVCRGAQMINTYFGGSLQKFLEATHVATKHKISLLSSYYADVDEVEVNSYHNFGIFEDNLAQYLNTFAYKNEENGQKSIEGFIHKNLPIYGVMWHPEREKIITTLDKQFFQKIFEG